MISEGRLQIGTREQPIQSKVSSYFIAETKTHLIFQRLGNKVIALMGGILDIHGKERFTHDSTRKNSRSWESLIVVQGTVDWVAEYIVIASNWSSIITTQNQELLLLWKILQTQDKTTITFVEALKHRHYRIQIIDGVEFEMRAEVGPLSRNVAIQGDETSQSFNMVLILWLTLQLEMIAQLEESLTLKSDKLVKHLTLEDKFNYISIRIGNVRESHVYGNLYSSYLQQSGLQFTVFTTLKFKTMLLIGLWDTLSLSSKTVLKLTM